VSVPPSQLALCVLHVNDLVESIAFYEQVLDLTVSLRTDDAAMLTTADGCRLVLREMGDSLEPRRGSVGVQYVVWSAAGSADLDDIELRLKCLDGRVGRQTIAGVTYLEGRDPSGLPIIVTNPLPHPAPPVHIFKRIYGR
jgi:hypothetical protein